MAISATREEEVMFTETVGGFDDALVIAKGADTLALESPERMMRLGDKVWIPQPMIATAYDGFDQSSNFGNITELAVPVSIGFHKSVNFSASSKDLRNARALNEYGKAAKQQLASAINLALFQTVALQGSLFVKRTTAPSGFDDLAVADAVMTEIGVGQDERMAFLAPRVMNAMASNLGARQTFDGAAQDAYARARVGIDIAGFDVYKNDQSIRLAAAAGGATTVNGAGQKTVPASFTTNPSAPQESENKDNRYTDLVVTSANYAGIKLGDAFTIAGVNSINMITKQDTGQLQTFRVISKPAANTIRVYPAIIDPNGGSKAEKEYGNVTAAPANGAAMTWLNTTTAELNPFFKKETLKLLPGTYAVDPNDGWAVLRATTDLGIAITYTRQGAINDLSVKGRWDIDFGTALVNPQFAGAMMFNQA